jgi:hypothetical protein
MGYIIEFNQETQTGRGYIERDLRAGSRIILKA